MIPSTEKEDPWRRMLGFFNGFNGSKLAQIGSRLCACPLCMWGSWQLSNSSTGLLLFDLEWICLFCVLAGWQLCSQFRFVVPKLFANFLPSTTYFVVQESLRLLLKVNKRVSIQSCMLVRLALAILLQLGNSLAESEKAAALVSLLCVFKDWPISFCRPPAPKFFSSN